MSPGGGPRQRSGLRRVRMTRVMKRIKMPVVVVVVLVVEVAVAALNLRAYEL